MNLKPLKKFEIQNIFRNKYAKYLSQHNPNRHYIISYNQDGSFTNETYENNLKIGTSHGTYLISTINKNAILNIKYNKIHKSPNIESPFHPQNSFYPHLSDYQIGPFYTKFIKENTIWLPILYNHLHQDKGFKVLNFYDKLL